VNEDKLVALTMRGGLGNQMFSYATGLALAKRLGGDLRFSPEGYEEPTYRPYELNAFGINIQTWRTTRSRWRLERAARVVTAGLWRPGPEGLRERNDYEPAVMTIQAPCFLSGYFQSWRYFSGAEEDIREAFNTDRLSTVRTQPLESTIREAACPVAVHIRRGDYELAADAWGLLDAAHYDRARQALEPRATNKPTYFLFSDDLPKATALLAHWDNVVPVAGLNGLEDFRLMSICRHFFIANSTYSWWAAWLGRAADKLVFAPSVWFKASERPIDEFSRLPPDWIRV